MLRQWLIWSGVQLDTKVRQRRGAVVHIRQVAGGGAQRQIDAVRAEVQRGVGCQQLNGDLRIQGVKRGQQWRHDTDAQIHRRRQTQMAGWYVLRGAGAGTGIGQQRQGVAGLEIERRAFFCGADRAGSTGQQSHAKALLQTRQATADAALGFATFARGGGQGAKFNHGAEGVQVFQ